MRLWACSCVYCDGCHFHFYFKEMQPVWAEHGLYRSLWSSWLPESVCLSSSHIHFTCCPPFEWVAPGLVKKKVSVVSMLLVFLFAIYVGFVIIYFSKGNNLLMVNLMELQILNCLRACLIAQLAKNLPAMHKTWVWSLDQEDPLEKEMATHSGILAWRIPLTEEPGGP